jgi:hypothetical protein
MTLTFTPRNNKDLKFTHRGKVAPNGRGTVLFTYTMPFQQQGDVLICLDVFVDGKKLAEPLVVKALRENRL